jgi:hypothetical protein
MNVIRSQTCPSDWEIFPSSSTSSPPRPVKTRPLPIRLALAAIGFGLASVAPLPGAVTNTNDNGPGSLRQSIADASAGSTITFDPALSGQTITLGTGQLHINKNLVIDASALPDGITIDANGEVTNHRVMEVTFGVTATLTKLHLTGGKAVGVFPNNSGGGIFNNGSLTFNHATLSGNSADGSGGGVYNSSGSLTLNNSIIAGNTGDNIDGSVTTENGNNLAPMVRCRTSARWRLIPSALSTWPIPTTMASPMSLRALMVRIPSSPSASTTPLSTAMATARPMPRNSRR